MTILSKRSGDRPRTPEEVEREVSTDEKVRRILPDLLALPTPAGKGTWDCYLAIKHVRDAVTHFKRRDQMPQAERSHEPTALLDLYTLDCFKLPEDAAKVLTYFQSPVPRWMMNPGWKRDAPGNLPPVPE